MEIRLPRILWTLLLVGCTIPVAWGQVVLMGRLENVLTNNAIPFATIHIQPADSYTLTDSAGFFSVKLPRAYDTLLLDISGIGLRTQYSLKPRYGTDALNLIPIDQAPTQVDEVLIEGLSAAQVVARAVAAIPNNYPTESFAMQSFYRQYYEVDRKYNSLIEAQPVVLFQPRVNRKNVLASYAYAIPHMRRTPLQYFIEDTYYGQELDDLMRQNPVYHIDLSSLGPSWLAMATFTFDTITEKAFVIRYESPNHSNDPHGIENFYELNWLGESSESGSVHINRDSWAITRYTRKAIRNPKYNYPRNNNFVLPSRKYRLYFVDSDLIVTYAEIDGQWYPQRLLYQFTNRYFINQPFRLAHTVTENYEWYAQKVSKWVDESLIDQFFALPQFSGELPPYVPKQWPPTLPEFFFAVREQVYQHLTDPQTGKIFEE